MMKFLFFGEKGYLGRHLVEHLRRIGHEVVTPVTLTGDRLDLTTSESFININWDVNYVFMFAGITGTGISFNEYSKFILGNEIILLNVLESIKGSSFRPRVIFPSTRLIYKGSQYPIAEDGKKDPKTIYAANKLACEKYLKIYANSFDIPFLIFRICVPYGNLIGDKYSFGTVGNFIDQAKNTGRIRIYGDGMIKRTFTHIDDLCRIIMLTTEHASSVNQTYNIPGEDLSLHQCASLIATKYNSIVESVPWPELDVRIESGTTVFDCSKLTKVNNLKIKYQFSKWVNSISIDKKIS